MLKPRPKHLDLTKIRLPLPALVSIMHRISGALLFLFIPLVLWIWQESLGSPRSFEAVRAVVEHPIMKLLLLGLLWGYLHHLCAGIRHLALDLHIGTELESARATSWVVLGAGIGLTLVAAVALW